MTHQEDHPPTTSPANAKPDKVNECATCGHNRIDHIREEGACRPGYVCPAKCEEFAPTDMVTINPQDAKPDEVYEGTVDGKRLTLRRTPDNAYEWESFSDVHDDREVTNLVCLVPAREVSHEDRGELWALIRDELRREYPSATDDDHRTLDVAASAAADAVVAHLNANGGVPQSADSTYGIPREDYEYVDWPATCAAANERADRAEAERDRWRRAHAIVEQGRNQARSERDEWKAKLDSLRVAYSNLDARADKIVERLSAAGRERDEWRERATALDARDRTWYGHRIRELKVGWRSAIDRAIAAEARTAPAVTREAVKGVIDHWIEKGGNHEALLDDLWRWVSGADPAVFVVRESDLPEVSWTYDGWTDGTRHGWEGTSETAMECVETHLEWARFYLAASRAIEAEPADPVEPEGDVIVRDAHDRMWWVTDDGWTNGTSRLDHDWADVPKPIRVTYRAESETKR